MAAFRPAGRMRLGLSTTSTFANAAASERVPSVDPPSATTISTDGRIALGGDGAKAAFELRRLVEHREDDRDRRKSPAGGRSVASGDNRFL